MTETSRVCQKHKNENNNQISNQVPQTTTPKLKHQNTVRVSQRKQQQS